MVDRDVSHVVSDPKDDDALSPLTMYGKMTSKLWEVRLRDKDFPETQHGY